jgi:hypothetical protein
MSIIRLIISVVVSVAVAQGLWLLVAGFFGEKFIGPLALLALPMTLAFFGVPACLPSLAIIAATFYGLTAAGHRRLVPLILAVCGLAWMAYLLVAKPTPSGAFPGYDQTLQFNVAGVLVVWAAYAHWRLAFKSDSVRQVLKQ